MNKQKLAALVLLASGAIATGFWYLHDKDIAVLNPHGQIAGQERHLMIVTVLLGVIVGVPVYIMLFAFAWRYRESNTKAKYSPELAGNAIAETLWWGIPSAIILVLSVITWQTSHSLDPKRTISSANRQLTIQVIALDWKWLFIYPEQNVASLNFIELPVGTPVEFDVTADAPMNSLWIPQLGGQIYAMPGMSTELHLIANQAGDYRGSSANISGSGFAGMHFIARAASMDSFNQWVEHARQSPQALDNTMYAQLVKPSQDDRPRQYAPVAPNLYADTILKFMGPRG